MKVEVVCFGAMREYLPDNAVGNTVDLDVAQGASVADVVSALGAPERLVHAVLVGADPADLQTELKEGDRITLMPHYSGGRK